MKNNKRYSFLFLSLCFIAGIALFFPQKTFAITGFKILNLSPVADSEINIDKASTNYGALPNFSTQALASDRGVLGTGIGVDIDPEISAVIKFNLASIPSGAFINSAYLKLYAYHVNANAPCDLVLYRFTGDWDERRITYTNSPSDVNLSQYHFTVNHTGYNGVQGWDFTSLVRKWMAREFPNYGIRLRNQSGHMSSLCKFYSKDETVRANQDKKPQLIVEYLPPLKLNSTSIPVNQISDTVANVYWETNNPVLSTVYYRKATVQRWDTLSNNETLTSNRVILQQLTPNTTYMVRVKVKDAANREISSQDMTFTTKPRTIARITPPSYSRLDPNLFKPTPTPTLPVAVAGQRRPSSSSEKPDSDIYITNLTIESSETGGYVRWATKKDNGSSGMVDVKTGGFVYLAKDREPTKDNHDFDFGKSQGEIQHVVEMKYLEPNTTYQYLIFSEDDDSHTVFTRGTFTTGQGVVNITPAEEEHGTSDTDVTDANLPVETPPAIDGTNSGESTSSSTTSTEDNSDDVIDAIQKEAETDKQAAAKMFISGLRANTVSRSTVYAILLGVLIVILFVLVVTKRKMSLKKTDKDIADTTMHDKTNLPVKQEDTIEESGEIEETKAAVQDKQVKTEKKEGKKKT